MFNFEMCPGENTHLGLHLDHIVLTLKETNNVECSIIQYNSYFTTLLKFVFRTNK